MTTFNKEDYEREMAAVKLYDFYKRLDEFLAVYAELKLYYADFAVLVEKQYPFLIDMYDNALKQRSERTDVNVVNK